MSSINDLKSTVSDSSSSSPPVPVEHVMISISEQSLIVASRVIKDASTLREPVSLPLAVPSFISLVILDSNTLKPFASQGVLVC